MVPTSPSPRPEQPANPEIALLELVCLPTPYEQTYPLASLTLSHPHLRWGGLIELAVDHKVLCLLADYLTHTGLLHEQKPHRARFLARQLRLNQYTLHYHRREAARIAQAFTDASIPYAAVSGIAVESTLYYGRGERPLSDIDLVIEHSRLAAADTVLTKLGYQPIGQTRRRSVGPYTRTLADPLVPRIVVDLTHQLNEVAVDYAPFMAEMVRRRTAQPIPGSPDVLLSVPQRAVHAAYATIALWDKAHRSRQLTLLSCADLLRLWHHAIQAGEADAARQVIVDHNARSQADWVFRRLDRAMGSNITNALKLDPQIGPPAPHVADDLATLLYGNQS
ncbi:hypothetical protein GCM10022225_27490 [Plantactinospora mayteni]|uniref:Nucleotidyltransferase family protein n=1 Tax=Plantactinospora mayteni TaxID=566021 RepID=A0ABQ4EIG7_9ACTN|nr:nucleotidyltransferase family protein [Plantactinospora mayteni]GIG94521.1 hypothetical protein Pma05_10940 [Plantactinospora mayteni]